MADQPTTAEQDYLKAIHRLGGADQLVSPADIASRLRVRAPSVTGMLKRLAEAGWIEYESGRGPVSPSAASPSAVVIRRHRLVELLLYARAGSRLERGGRRGRAAGTRRFAAR